MRTVASRERRGVQISHSEKYRENIFIDGEPLMFSTSEVLFEGDEVEVRMENDVPEVHVTKTGGRRDMSAFGEKICQ